MVNALELHSSSFSVQSLPYFPLGYHSNLVGRGILYSSSPNPIHACRPGSYCLQHEPSYAHLIHWHIYKRTFTRHSHALLPTHTDGSQSGSVGRVGGAGEGEGGSVPFKRKYCLFPCLVSALQNHLIMVHHRWVHMIPRESNHVVI